MGKQVRWLKQHEAKLLGLEIKPNEKKRSNARYRVTKEQWRLVKENRSSNDTPENVRKKENKDTPFVLSAWNNKGYMMDIDEYCKHYNLPRNDVKSYKLVSHTGTPFYNILFKEKVSITNEIDYSFIEDIVKKHIVPFSPNINKHYNDSETFDRVVISDIHIGMTPNKDGNSLYGGKWDEDELFKRLTELVKSVIQNQTSSELYIDDLGDYLDGWDGETTRKGHKLPQNMTNKEAFDVAVRFKVLLIDELINYYSKITLNNICEDNHSGDFGYVVNSAVKSILEMKYENVKIVNHLKFINHYYVGKHCFVISHGKDSKNLKFGFKPQLDSKQIEKIDQYCKHNNIYKKSDFVEFSKGDSHQMIFDYATSDDFDYFNFPAFSPSSDWVQTNFKMGRSGFVIFSIDYNSNKKDVKPYWF